ALVRHGEQATDPAGDRVLREWRIRVVAELVEARVAVREPQIARLPQVVGNVLAEDLERPLDARARGHGGLRGAPQVRVVEVHEAVHPRTHLPALTEVVP